MIRIADESLYRDWQETEESGEALLQGAASFMEAQTMKKHVVGLCTLALLAVSLPNLFAQGSQPSQPGDPTTQAPATPAPATPPTFPTSEAKPQRDRGDVRVYMGTIVKDGDVYVLKAGNEKYLLDSRDNGYVG